MKSYKQWQIVNESFLSGMTLGLKTPQTIGGLQSNRPLISEKKKMSGKVVVDDNEDLGDDHEDSDDHKEPDGDEGDCGCKKKDDVAFSKKNMKKKMKKKMEVEVDDDKGDGEGEEDDINDVKAPKSKSSDDDEEGDDDNDDDGDGDDKNDDDEEGGDDDGAKYGFMKDKKKKKMKKKMEENFWNDIKSYRVPKNAEEGEKEFFESLARQYGTPKQEKFSSGIQGDGINEDLLLSPEQQALIDAMDGEKPGDVGFAPSQRMGFGFVPAEEGADETYEEAVEESADYEVLCKYFSEDMARQIIERSRN